MSVLDILGFTTLLVLTIAFVWSGKSGLWRSLVALGAISLLAWLAYLELGAWRELRINDLQLKVMGEQGASPEERIALRGLLEDMASDEQSDPRYAYLLGHTLLADEDYEAAREAFLGLRERGVQDLEVDISYVQSDFLARDGVLGEGVRRFARSLIDSDNPVLLEILVLDALRSNDQQAFMEVWPRYAGTPRGSALAQSLGQQLDLPNASEPAPDTAESLAGPLIHIALSATAELEAPPDTPVFLLARDANAPGPPLAVRRFRFADLPLRVTLSDADAMLETNKISNASEVEVVARLALSGGPIAAEGDIEVSSGALRLDQGPHEIVLVLAGPQR